MTRDEMRLMIEQAAAAGGQPSGYDGCANMAAGMVLAFLRTESDPGRWSASGETDCYDQVNALTDGKLGALGLTGFMWGWAVNAARYVLDLDSVANPAIITLGQP